MTCGIRLAEAGRRCAIVSQGQSAIHFSSGSFDLLGRLPDGTAVSDPVAGIAALEKDAPEHPYAVIGARACEKYAQEAPRLLREAGIPVSGDCRANHFRITPMGKAVPTWLTIDGYLTAGQPGALPFRKVCIVNVEGFLDFYPEFIAEEFREALAASICEAAADSEAVILPAIIGINRNDALEILKQKVAKPLYLLPTLPPSIPGIKAQQLLQRRFRALGGEYFLGDTVLPAETENGHVRCVRTANHGNIPFEARDFVLATGSFFSRGLIASPDRILEPVFGADTLHAPSRAEWYTQRFFDRQNYQAFGIRTDRSLRVVKEGVPVDNLYCAGAGLAGFHPVQDGCGAGVSLLSALHVADRILNSKQS